MDAKIIRIGNSQGVRLSREYLEKRGLKEGDSVIITVRPAKPDPAKAVAALERLAEQGGLGIDDPVAWQNEQRSEWGKRERQYQ